MNHPQRGRYLAVRAFQTLKFENPETLNAAKNLPFFDKPDTRGMVHVLAGLERPGDVHPAVLCLF